MNMGHFVTRFTGRFGCRYPFACAGMAFAATTNLALAVCRGGGIGAIGVGFTPAEELRAMIRHLRSRTQAALSAPKSGCRSHRVIGGILRRRT
jgi:NAD(P)H-dependent flavin oxidoreductase YrpB (nitropropane dioxygenase family)